MAEGRSGGERREERRLERFHQQLERHDLPVLDELGYFPCTKAGAELLFEAVSRACERTRPINLTPGVGWGIYRLGAELLARHLPRFSADVHSRAGSFALPDSEAVTRYQATASRSSAHPTQAIMGR